MRRWCLLLFVALVAALLTSAPAAAQIELRFAPVDQHIALGEHGSLAIRLDAALEVRTVELWISYDPLLLTGSGGQAGELFTASGCGLFPVFDEDEPGAWYGGVAALGPNCFVTGPGELFRWNFEGLANGVCHVHVDSVVLYSPLAEPIAGVSLAGTRIVVGDVSAVESAPTRPLALSLRPNPFNPGTTIQFGGRPEEILTVAVFDVIGRRVDTLWSGRIGAEPGVVHWDGTDRRGRAAPGGVYLFRILGQGDRQVTRKGILLK